MYGSDKTLWYLITHLPKEEFKIIVVLPNSGPLQELLEKSNIKVSINAHTDDKGTDDYNKNLSQRRGASVFEYLSANSYAPEAIPKA